MKVAFPSLNVAPSRTVEVSLVHTIAFRALKVIEVINAEDLMIRQVVLCLDSEKRLSAH